MACDRSSESHMARFTPSPAHGGIRCAASPIAVVEAVGSCAKEVFGGNV